jgi:hypothetical protein
MIVKLQLTPEAFKELLKFMPRQHHRARLANRAEYLGPCTFDGEAEELQQQISDIVNEGK